MKQLTSQQTTKIAIYLFGLRIYW